MKQVQRKFSAALAFAAVFCPAAAAFADEAAMAAAASHGNGLMAIAIAIGIGLAVLGGAFGQSRAAAAALEGIARNPNASDKVFVPMILGLSFIESLVLFAWVLMFMLLNKM
jgi:F-type H+-transporting ATPase subunit c